MAKKQSQAVPTGPAAAKPAPQPAAKEKKGLSLAAKLSFLLGIIAFLVYANTFKHDYALDDFTVIKNNSIVTKGISATLEILTTPYRRGWFITTNDLYRPLSLVMFAAEWQLADGQPGISHFINVLIYAGCVILLFRFLNSLFYEQKTGVAFIAALLFALHPIHTEVVANIKSRDELLCFFFAFLSLQYYLKYMNSGNIKTLLLASASFFLAFLSKETVISFLFVIPFVFYLFRNEDKSRSLKITISAVAVTAAFLLLRFSVLRHYGANLDSKVTFIDNVLVSAPSAAGRFATELLVLFNYLKLLIVPYPLVCDYSFNSIPFTTFGDFRVIIGLVVYLALAVLGVMRLIKNPKDPYAFGIIFFLSTIALFSNIVFIIGAAMAERFVFFASVGFCLLIALLVEQFLAGKNGGNLLTNTKVLAVLVPVCLLYGYTTMGRNNDWADNVTLFRADAPKAPDDARLNYYLGTEILSTYAKKEGNPEVKKTLINESIVYLRKSLATYPEYTDGNASLGDAFFTMGIYDSAEYYDQRSLKTNPNFTVAINNLAGVYFMTNNYGKALEVCKKAVELNPGYSNAYANIGLCYIRMGKYDSSLLNLYKAMALDPNLSSTYDNLVIVYRALGKADSVAKYQQKLNELKGLQ
jgi:hypothetical protein